MMRSEFPRVFYDRFMKWESQWSWPLNFQVWVLVEDRKECWNSSRGSHGAGTSLGEYHRVWGRQGVVPVAGLLPSGEGHLKPRGKDGKEAQSTSFESGNGHGIGEDHTGRSWDKYHERWVKLKHYSKLSSKRNWNTRSEAAPQRCKGEFWRTAEASKGPCRVEGTALALDSETVRCSCHWCPLLLLDCVNIF